MPDENSDAIERLRLVFEVWAKAVDTQMHFNEMSVKSRQLGLSFVIAALGISVVLLTRNVQDYIILIPFGNSSIKIHASALIIGVAAFGLNAVRLLDLTVYHRMLRGAVQFGERLEDLILRDELMKTEKGMTELISFYSRHNAVKKVVTDGKVTFQGIGETTAEVKIKIFYRYSILTLIVISLILLIVFNI